MTEPTDETIRAIAEAALRDIEGDDVNLADQWQPLRDIYMHVAKAAHAASTRARWIAGRDAAAKVVDEQPYSTLSFRFLRCVQDGIRALTPPPEDKS